MTRTAASSDLPASDDTTHPLLACIPPASARAAALTTAAHATGASEARQFLDMLGLTPAAVS